MKYYIDFSVVKLKGIETSRSIETKEIEASEDEDAREKCKKFIRKTNYWLSTFPHDTRKTYFFERLYKIGKNGRKIRIAFKG